ncbi:MAG: anaerobic ribonucleoside-triphosphate reductase [Christensenellales bacterium]|jgi:hypothetical protein
MNKHVIQGVVVAFNDGEPHSREEAEAYLEYARKKCPRISSLIVKRDGEYSDLTYTTKEVPFERIRRITGYLSDTRQWNPAKQAELHDRVCHVQDGSVAAGLIEEGEG